jgi:hypothetical protein
MEFTPYTSCPECGGEKKETRDCVVCIECGLIQNEYITMDIERNPICRKKNKNKDSDEPLPSETPAQITQLFSKYSKECHLNEVLAQRKGAGGEINDYVFYLVGKELVKYRGWPLNERLVLHILASLNERTSYDYAIQVLQRLRGIYYPFTNPEQDERIREMHREAKQAWQHAPEHIKRGKRSFPNYKDFIKRCCVYLGYKEQAKTLRGLRYWKTIRRMNMVWAYFGETCRWKGYQVSFMPEHV